MAIALSPTSIENQKEVDNTDDNIIFLKNSFLNHFQDLKDPRIDRTLIPFINRYYCHFYISSNKWSRWLESHRNLW